MSAARDKVIGSTIRNTAEMPPMATEIQPINSADVAPVVRVALVVLEGPVARVALVVPEDPVARVASVGLEGPAARVASAVPEDPVARVASVGLESPVARAGLVVSESPAVPVVLVVPVAAALEHGQVAALERELAQAAAVPVANHPRARLAVPLRIKSVTARHRRDRVPAPRVEDSAAAVETTREQVAAEAVTAWEAAE